VRSREYQAIYNTMMKQQGQDGKKPGRRQTERVFAIDCEMVQTTAGIELARVTLIADRALISSKNGHDNEDDDDEPVVILDTYVCPYHPVTDYKTQFSGITAASLEGVNVTLEQVQVALMTLIPAEAILTGHSLDSDLQALKFVHGRTVDTAVLYPHPRGFPYRQKLKFLAKELLGLNIQQLGNTKKGSGKAMAPLGHDSVEDAMTAFKLVVAKLEGGPTFGLQGNSEARLALMNRLGLRNVQSLLAWETVDESTSNTTTNGGAKKEKELHTEAMESCIGAETKVFRHHNFDAVIEKVSNFLSSKRTRQLGVGTDLGETWWKDSCKTTDDLVKHALDPMRICSVNVCRTLANRQTVQQTVTSLRAALSVGSHPNLDQSALIITAQPSLERVQRLQERKRLCMSQAATLSTLIWSAENEMELKAELKKTQLGRVAFSIL
jgi:DNA polymerase III epsilon subunit-like protein